MLKISLDPEISIQPFNEYVSIRGVIELQGEYQKSDSLHATDEEAIDLDDHYSHRYVEDIEELEEDKAKFSHRFPVEISVPSYRVSSIDDITVGVETFDYEIPNESQLKLMSTIEIRGISEQIAESENDLTEVEQHRDLIEEDNQEKEAFAFDVKIPDDSEGESEIEKDRKELIHSETESEPETSVNITESITEEDVENEASEQDETDSMKKDRWKFKKVQSFEDFFKEKSDNTSEDSVEAEMEIDKEETISELDMEDSSEKLIETESDVDSREDVTYLADMFRDDEEDEKYSQMRICIVQDHDTVEAIAEKYNITESQLLRQNRLEDSELSVGQLLLIPQKK